MMKYLLNKHSAQIALRISLALMVVCQLFASLLYPAVAYAITQRDLDAITNNRPFYSPGQDCAEEGALGSLAGNQGVETPKWVTTLQPPYNLEDFAVEALRALAQKQKVPESSTLTQEHVLFFVAYTQREGGNITNNSLYNPWNTGYTAPDLRPAKHDVGGAQAYLSFNDGVEAYARVWSGTAGSSGYQSRMGLVLSQPSSTAEDLARALVYYKQYPGNKAWASASEEPNASKYLQSTFNTIQTARSNYTSIASLLIGPPGNSDRKNLHVPKPLRYKFEGDRSTNTGTLAGTEIGDECATNTEQSSVVSQNMVQTAINLSWGSGPDECPGGNCKHGLQAKPAYLEALRKYANGGAFGGADCGSFVSTVMRSSGVDPNFPTVSTNVQEPYMRNHPEKYQVVANLGNTSNLQPGDIFVVGKAGAAGHIFMYLGPQPNGKNAAGASMKSQMPYQHNVYYSNSYNDQFKIYRVIK